jgi:Zn-dependent oligopeptidase
MRLGSGHVIAIAFFSIAFIMVRNVDTAPLVLTQGNFNPSITFFQYRTEWRRAENIARQRFALTKNPPTNDALEFLHILDDLNAFIKMHNSEAELWRGSHPVDQMRDEADTAIAFFDGLLRKIKASRDIAQRLDNIKVREMDEGSRRFLDLSRRNARRAGAFLDKEERKEFRLIRSQLEDLEGQFERNIAQDDSRVWIGAKVMDDMDEDFEDFDVDPSTGLVAIPATSEAAITLLRTCEDDATAEKMYKAMYNVAPANEEVLQRMLELRYQEAKLLGYHSYIDYAMEIDTLVDATTVREHLLEASRQVEVQAKDEMAALSAVLKTKGRQLQAWNFLYAKEQLLKERLLGLGLDDARKYLAYKDVVPRLFEVLGELFDLEFRKAEDVETWHPSVQVYDVIDQCSAKASSGGHPYAIETPEGEQDDVHSSRFSGRIYLDLVDRPYKDEEPDTVRIRNSVFGNDLIPTVCVCGSYVLTESSFFDLDFLSSLFRQLGRAMHLLAAQNSKFHLFDCPERGNGLDEIPGQVLEELLLDETFLRRIAVDESGGSITPRLLEALLVERKIDNGMFMREQVLYSLLCVSINAEDAMAHANRLACFLLS